VDTNLSMHADRSRSAGVDPMRMRPRAKVRAVRRLTRPYALRTISAVHDS
jgi:hypothetical protein